MEIYGYALSQEQEKFIRKLKYLFWWENEDEFLQHPEQTLAHAMDMFRQEDWLLIEELFPKDVLQKVLSNASMGDFQPPGWVFWHVRLYGVLDDDLIPPMPQRRIPTDFNFRISDDV